jgi:Imelysin
MRGRLTGAIVLVTVAGSALALGACGSDDEDADEATTEAAASADLDPVKDYLTEHAADLSAATAALRENAESYYRLAQSVGMDYDRLLRRHREQVRRLIAEGQRIFREANPAYEEMEGIVAGVPELATYDVILDAGAPAKDDPQAAVPFDLELPDGRTLKQPGNFFFLTETSLWGTNPAFVAKGTKPDLNGDGKVSFGEALPDASFYVAAAREFERYANELEEKAAEFEPTDADALGALVIMTPTMSEYFEAWKNSRFIAGEDASELGFVAASRLSDIADILEGLVFVYEGVEPVVADADPQQAQQTERSLKSLHRFVVDLREREADGTQFTAEQADTLGSAAQERAEAIAGQVSQAAAMLDIELPEA